MRTPTRADSADNPASFAVHPIEITRRDGTVTVEYADNCFDGIHAAMARALLRLDVVKAAPVIGASVPVRAVRG